MKKSEYIDRVAIREKVCTGCTMLVDGVCRDADPCEKLIAGFLEELSADVVPAHPKKHEHTCPCDLCDFGPPSSMNGKPCTMCPAVPKQERNEPLTLDELLQMNGEPVWIVEYPDWGHWELSADAGDYVAERDYDSYGMKHDDPAGRYGLHKLGWLAYRQKPEEGTI